MIQKMPTLPKKKKEQRIELIHPWLIIALTLQFSVLVSGVPGICALPKK